MVQGGGQRLLDVDLAPVPGVPLGHRAREGDIRRKPTSAAQNRL